MSLDTCAWDEISRHTLCKMVDGQLSVRVLRQKLERNLGLSLSYHEMYDDQALEYDGPCRVAQSVRKGAEDLSDTSFAGMRRDEDVFDILGFGCCELRDLSVCCDGATSANDVNGRRVGRRIATLILVPPLTLFSKELAMSCYGYCRSDRSLPGWAAGCVLPLVLPWVAGVLAMCRNGELGCS
jgi:hypothetical protein